MNVFDHVLWRRCPGGDADVVASSEPDWIKVAGAFDVMGHYPVILDDITELLGVRAVEATDHDAQIDIQTQQIKDRRLTVFHRLTDRIDEADILDLGQILNAPTTDWTCSSRLVV